MYISRYPDFKSVTTPLDPLSDLIDWLRYLTSYEYLLDILTTRHGLLPSDAKSRAKQILPHISTAISFIDQSLTASPEVSFLPAYYALLNLAKVYVLVGPRHADLPSQRWHGVTYSGIEKDSRS